MLIVVRYGIGSNRKLVRPNLENWKPSYTLLRTKYHFGCYVLFK